MILGNGIDIVSVKRIENMLKKKPRVLNRILTAGEIEYCRSKKRVAEHAAGRIALKEAIYKALKDRGVTLLWNDMEIESDGSSPFLSKKCRAYSKLKEKKISFSLSISHEREFAVASALFWEEK